MATVGIVALAQASKEYQLKCTKEEMGIRWPNYMHHSEYFVCPRIGGKQMTVACNAGEVFTFVLQSCTSPSKYIPAPALEILPTASPLQAAQHTQNKYDDGLPKPLTMTNHQQPPVLSEKPQMLEVPHIRPAVHVPVHHPEIHQQIPEIHHPHHNQHADEPEHVSNVEVVPQHHEAKPEDLPPMPPTPAPTPPVVSVEQNKKPATGSKKPVVAQKKPSVKPSKDDKKKPATASKSGKKTPAKPSKQAAKKAAPAPKAKKAAAPKKTAANKA